MLKLEQYKLFHNSEDFDFLYKKSVKYLLELHTDLPTFYNTVLKKAIQEKTIFIFYIDFNPVGYVIFSLKGKKAFWDFDFIIENKTYRKYVRIFRTSVLLKIKDRAEELEFIIFKNNYKSLNSMFKLPKHTKIKVDQKESNINNIKTFSFKIDLNQLDNLKLCDSLNTYEIRSCLHFGTFAPEITGTEIQNDDEGTIQQKTQK